jgi:predicted phage replisome organizer
LKAQKVGKMADNQKYYYMRLKEDFFDSNDAVKILEAMPDGYLYSNILLKLYLKSLKFNGRLMYNDRIPYNAEVLATLTNHKVGVVEKALDYFEQLGLIEVLDNGAIYMLDIQNYIGKSSTEADRKREYRNQIEAEKKLLLGQTSGQMSDISTPEIETEIELESEIETETKRERTDYQRIVDMYNDTCVSFPRVKTLSDDRKKAIKARLKKYGYDDFQTLFSKAEASAFLKGANDRNWSATFDWLIKDSNMAKVLDGNYDSKQQVKKPAGSFNNFQQRQYTAESMIDIERKMLQKETPKTAADDANIRERAEALKKQFSS